MQTSPALFEVCVVEHCPDLLTGMSTEMKASATGVFALSFFEQSTLALVDRARRAVRQKRRWKKRGNETETVNKDYGITQSPINPLLSLLARKSY